MSRRIQDQHVLSEDLASARADALVAEVHVSRQLPNPIGLQRDILEKLVLAAGIDWYVETLDKLFNAAHMIDMKMREIDTGEVQSLFLNAVQKPARIDTDIHNNGFVARTDQVTIGLVRSENECFYGQGAHDLVDCCRRFKDSGIIPIARNKMLYFLGNCQMDFLSLSVADLGFSSTHRVLASPLTYTSSPGRIPAEPKRLFDELGLHDHVHGRTLDNQFHMIGPDDEPPELIVMNLFHENTPLTIHNRDRYAFFLDPAAWESHPELDAWVRAECGLIRPNPATYLKRYGEFLATVRTQHPGIPIIVVSRLSHFPAFGPQPYSYLEGWEGLSHEASTHFRVWQRELDNVHVIDIDRVFGGIWNDAPTSIDSHCPFFKIELEETNGAITGLKASRDVEHIGSMWSRLATKIAGFFKSGEISYSPGETVPRAWNRPWRPRLLTKPEMLERLASGGNYQCAEAVGAFYLDLQTDYTDLLAQTGHLTPVCHNTLHMIKNYGRIFKNPAMTLWCDAHEKTARQFTANGPLYQADYLKRIGDIRAFALS